MSGIDPPPDPRLPDPAADHGDIGFREIPPGQDGRRIEEIENISRRTTAASDLEQAQKCFDEWATGKVSATGDAIGNTRSGHVENRLDMGRIALDVGSHNAHLGGPQVRQGCK